MKAIWSTSCAFQSSGGIYPTSFSTKNGKLFVCFGYSFTWAQRLGWLKMQTIKNKFQSTHFWNYYFKLHTFVKIATACADIQTLCVHRHTVSLWHCQLLAWHAKYGSLRTGIISTMLSSVCKRIIIVAAVLGYRFRHAVLRQMHDMLHSGLTSLTSSFLVMCCHVHLALEDKWNETENLMEV